MKILFAASEVVPFSKTGGLGDVSAALPAALAALGHEVVVVTPLYGPVKREGLSDTGARIRLRFPFGDETAGLVERRLSPNHRVLLLDHPGFFGNRTGLYGDHGGDYGDNHRRFAFLSVGALAAAQALNFDADIVHLNDWQTGLAAVALQRGYASTTLGNAKVVFTIHNLAYQGMFHKTVMSDLGLPWELFTANSLEYFDTVNFLKGGIAWADALTTVSPRYAREIQTPELGCNLDGLLRRRSRELHGILNGIDAREWDPSRDPHLPEPYSADDLGGKRAARRALLERFGLAGGDDGPPVFGVVSRLAAQKGMDLLLDTLPRVLERWDVRVVLLGNGDFGLEQQMEALRARFPDRLGIYVGFNNALSHLIEGGSDFFVMPSRYEPCGLNQLYSLRYGTVPMVRATGGLEDTVVDLGEPEPTGIKFHEFHPDALHHAFERAMVLFADRPTLDAVRRRGMRQDFSWDASARKYEALFQRLAATDTVLGHSAVPG